MSAVAPLVEGERIVGERIHLRVLTASDVSARYVGWLNDPLVNRYLETRHSEQDLERVAAFVDRVSAAPEEHLFAIRLNADDRHIGNIKVGPRKANHALADVSLFIGERDCWGAGYATEAIRLIGKFAFGRLGLLKLNATAYAENEGSIGAFLKAGYRREGLRRKHYLLRGEPADLVELGLCADDPEGAERV